MSPLDPGKDLFCSRPHRGSGIELPEKLTRPLYPGLKMLEGE